MRAQAQAAVGLDEDVQSLRHHGVTAGRLVGDVRPAAGGLGVGALASSRGSSCGSGGAALAVE